MPAELDINAKYVAAATDNNDSKKLMIYTSDNGNEYTTLISENIGEIMGFDDFTTSSTATEMPKGLKMRYVNFKDATGNVGGSYPVGKSSEEVFQEGGTIKVARKGKADGVVCAVTGAIGEKRSLQTANDTGQDSGDNS
jgi:hypothetical protein